jgi:hypothetical protein
VPPFARHVSVLFVTSPRRSENMPHTLKSVLRKICVY